MKMTCAEVREQLVFYAYGEVSPAVEEQVEAHLESCPECRAERARHAAFLEALDERQDFTDPALLVACRNDLRAAIQAGRAKSGWFDWLRDVAQMHIPFRVPVGALALLAVGFFGARLVPQPFGGVEAGVAAPMFSSVRSVEPDGTGRIEIAVDDVRRRVVSGNIGDPAIQALLVSAVRDEANPGVRVESIGALGNGGESDEVMHALIGAVTRDPDAGVRLKAIEALKQYAGHADVRRTLAGVLVKDDDPGVRVQAIDLLSAHHDPSIVGILQDAVQKEDNGYIRSRCRNLLEMMNASVGTY
ncbi:MAG TPA: HEAT repeat domain-containing protein [Bryobacteraceae bacterium]|nr:HEAT repeat domain-containing protein [Bryobacteraceae bacterium]